MIAVDTSTLIAYLGGASGDDVALLDHALADRQACLPPVVVTEMLSAPGLPKRASDLLVGLPRFETLDGFWERAGALRAALLAQGRKARLADTLIAQTCLDHGVALLTRDDDLRAFATISKLALAHG